MIKIKLKYYEVIKLFCNLLLTHLAKHFKSRDINKFLFGFNLNEFHYYTQCPPLYRLGD